MKTQAHTIGNASGVRDATVASWRFEQLLAAGFDPDAARELSRDCGVDLHALLDLVARGCSPALAVRILAPLAGESRLC